MAEDIASLSAWLQILSTFSAGLISVLTPCVYPLIPITLSVCGASRAESQRASFFLAFSYFLGIVVTYTTLGVISAQAGIVFGSMLGNPWVTWGASLFLFALMLHTLEIVNFSPLARLQRIGNTIGGRGVRGSFLMGAASGLIAAPCIGPVLAGVLVVAASSESAYWGGTLLFSYSIGLGLPFLVLGTFSSLIQSLPRSGQWLNWIKAGTAVGLLLLILFLHSSLFNRFIHAQALSAYPIALGGVLGFGIVFFRLGFRLQRGMIKIFAAFLITIPLYTFFIYSSPPTSKHSVSNGLPWVTTIEEAMNAAHKQESIIMVDLFAEWCSACKEFDTKTFSHPDVQASLQRMRIVRVDFTTTTESSSEIARRFNVNGLPCILFLRPDGTEIERSRVTGFMGAKDFLAHLHTLKF